MSRFLVLSEGGDGCGLALRLTKEGHEASLWIREGSQDKIGKGLVACSSCYEYGQTVVSDCTGFGSLMDKFRDADIKTFGGGSFADKLESDRGFSVEVMKSCGIETPLSISATSWEEAAEAVKSVESDKVVIKPEGALSGVVPSYVAKNEEDALDMLARFEKEHQGGEVELTIQEFVKGIDISTEGWFNGQDWVDGLFNHTLERKQLMVGDLGPSGGCTGNIVWSCDRSDPIVKQLLLKLTDALREHRYTGPIDINCVINDNGFYALEFTPRFGYDAFPTLLTTLFEGNFGEFIYDCENDLRTSYLRSGFGCGVRLTIPPWPTCGNDPKPVSLRRFDDQAKDAFYPYGVVFDEETGLRSCGSDGSLGVISCLGESISEGFARCYAIVSKLEISNVQYRTDFAGLFLKDFREIQRIFQGEEETSGWIGVDLDGTLAEYSGFSDEIGNPIGKMTQRVKRWLSEGKEVRILTARGTIDGQGTNKYEQLVKIHDWSREHLGEALTVTDRKDPEMIRLYDDRVRQVEEGTGELVGA